MRDNGQKDVELQSQQCRAPGADAPSLEPFVLEAGKIGELMVTIPYMSFWRKRCKLAMKGVRLRVAPMEEDNVRLLCACDCSSNRRQHI